MIRLNTSPHPAPRRRRRRPTTSVARRLVWRLRRHPALYWTVAIVVGGSTATISMGMVRRADEARRQWGEQQSVVVAVRDVGAGEQLTAADLELRTLPLVALPDGHLTRLPREQAAAVPLHAGEIVVRSRLAPAGRSGAAALVPRGHRALAIPLTSAPLPLQVGDHVDVLATFDLGYLGSDLDNTVGAATAAAATGGSDADGDGSGKTGEDPDGGSSEGLPPTFPVARSATVIHLDDEAVTVAMAAAEAERVAYALAQGIVTLALTSG